MNDKPTVYIITLGSYSDYRINAVFLDKAEAEAFIAAHKQRAAEMRERGQYGWSDDYAIETWPVGEIPTDRKVWRINFYQNGDVQDIELCEPGQEPSDPYIYRFHRSTTDDNPVHMNIHVEAADEASAIKIAAEKRAHFIASQLGMT